MSETLLNIDLTDLGGIKIICAQCHAAAEFPVAHLQADPPERCIHCRAEWFVSATPHTTALQHLVRALVLLRGREATSDCRVQLVMKLDRGSAPTRVPQ
jgi:hypothetical protein